MKDKKVLRAVLSMGCTTVRGEQERAAWAEYLGTLSHLFSGKALPLPSSAALK